MVEFMCELNDDDVVAMSKEFNFAHQPMTKYEDLIKALEGQLNFNHERRGTVWLTDGVECEVLRVGGGWLKGRMRLSLEFIPDTEESENLVLPQSPLDDLRAELLDE